MTIYSNYIYPIIKFNKCLKDKNKINKMKSNKHNIFPKPVVEEKVSNKD